MHSACVYENTCPMWRLPDTVGGGVSTEKTGAVDFGSNAWTPSRSHTACASGSMRLGSYAPSRGRGPGSDMGRKGYRWPRNRQCVALCDSECVGRRDGPVPHALTTCRPAVRTLH